MIEIDINLLLTFFWLSISAGILVPGIWLLIEGKTSLAIINIILQRFYLFGKLKNENKNKEKIFGDIPKSYFLHFYIIGLLINIPLFLFSRSSIFLFIMFICHMFRRLYECLYVHHFGQNSTMSFIHYLVGLIHYPLVGLTILIDNKYHYENLSILNYFFALLLFINASYIQYQVHLTLSKNRRTENENYPIPNGYWPFEYFSCPNYIAEIFIYISFLFVSHHTSCFMSLVIWVIVNQCLSALLTHRWYCQHYGQSYPSKRCALIPFIL
jgi:3-oxo-5-alpha-steroid 4-dehydrogenase 3